MLVFIAVVSFLLFFFFNDTATTEIYTLSLHDALPIRRPGTRTGRGSLPFPPPPDDTLDQLRSEEHTSELQSRAQLVCRLLLEKKKKFHLIVNDPVNKNAPIKVLSQRFSN